MILFDKKTNSHKIRINGSFLNEEVKKSDITTSLSSDSELETTFKTTFDNCLKDKDYRMYVYILDKSNGACRIDLISNDISEEEYLKRKNLEERVINVSSI